MKKRFVSGMVALTMALLTACGGSEAKTEETKAAAGGGETADSASGEEQKDYSWYTIRLYTNGNTTQMVDMVKDMAAEAGFTVSIDRKSVV